MTDAELNKRSGESKSEIDTKAQWNFPALESDAKNEKKESLSSALIDELLEYWKNLLSTNSTRSPAAHAASKAFKNIIERTTPGAGNTAAKSAGGTDNVKQPEAPRMVAPGEAPKTGDAPPPAKDLPAKSANVVPSKLS